MFTVQFDVLCAVNVTAPGVYMSSRGGIMAFVGGLLGHIAYGIVLALVYGAMAS